MTSNAFWIWSSSKEGTDKIIIAWWHWILPPLVAPKPSTPGGTKRRTPSTWWQQKQHRPLPLVVTGDVLSLRHISRSRAGFHCKEMYVTYAMFYHKMQQHVVSSRLVQPLRHLRDPLRQLGATHVERHWQRACRHSQTKSVLVQNNTKHCAPAWLCLHTIG